MPSLLALLDTLAGQDLLGRSPRSRERIVREVRSRGADVAGAIDALRATVLFLFYGLGDERGQNPNWRTLGYPGPFAPPPVADRPLLPYTPETDTTLEADVCVVGSGAGGGVMAGVLSEQGLSVVVLEAGGYFDDGDFTQLEIPAYRNLYWRGGPTSDRRSERRAAGRRLPGGRHGRQLDQLAAPHRARARAVGTGVRPGWPRRR